MEFVKSNAFTDTRSDILYLMQRHEGISWKTLISQTSPFKDPSLHQPIFSTGCVSLITVFGVTFS